MLMSQDIWVYQVLWYFAHGTEAWGQRVLCSWLMGSTPTGIQTTHRSSIAPKTGGFTLVGGVQLGHRHLMGLPRHLNDFAIFRTRLCARPCFTLVHKNNMVTKRVK